MSDEQSFNPDFFVYNVKCFAHLENKSLHMMLLLAYFSAAHQILELNQTKGVYNKLLRRVKHEYATSFLIFPNVFL